MQQFHPHPYQQAAIDAILAKPGVALWMEMGLGKTVVTLTAIDQTSCLRITTAEVPARVERIPIRLQVLTAAGTISTAAPLIGRVVPP